MVRQDIHRQQASERLAAGTYAMILAGGRGTRLHQLTDWHAKPAVPFGGRFRIIDFPLSNCVNSGIRRIGVATQYKAQSLIQHLKRSWSFLDGRLGEFIDVLPAQQRVEDNWYRGTADAVFQNLDLIREADPTHVLILAGDHVYKMDYERMLADHIMSDADMTVACIEVPRDEARAFGVMGIDGDRRIVRFAEKPDSPDSIPGKPERSLASMGIYVFRASFLYEQIERDAADETSSHDFGKDIIPYCVSRHRVCAHRFEDSCVRAPGAPVFWRDVGSVDAFWAANIELTREMPDLDLYDSVWPIWSDHDMGPPAKFVFDGKGGAYDSLVSGGSIINGATVRRSLISSNARLHRGCELEDAVLLPEVDVGVGARIRRAVIDKACRIPPGMSIGFDPEDDAKRFLVTASGICLVTPGMLNRA